MDKKVIVIFVNVKQNTSVDIEVPVDISARDLIRALNEAYNKMSFADGKSNSIA